MRSGCGVMIVVADWDRVVLVEGAWKVQLVAS